MKGIYFFLKKEEEKKTEISGKIVTIISSCIGAERFIF